MKKKNESLLKLRESPTEASIARASALGFAAQLLSRSKAHAPFSLMYLSSVVAPAIEKRLIKFYFGHEGQPVGYVIWAFLETDVEERFLETGQWDLHESEWKEGSSLWIVDFLAPYGHLSRIMKDLRDKVFKSQKTLRYSRSKNGQVICKELSRDSKCSFFARGTSAQAL
jgi:hemolysin-activating ACP:hemolysin acyltransferase